MTASPMRPNELRDFVAATLEDLKGRDVTCLDVSALSDFTDYMIVVNGTSNRHVNALVEHLLEAAKARGVEVLGVEGRESGEWVLLDLGDVVVHVMQPEARAFYDLERLWSDLSEASDVDETDAERGA